MARLSSRVQPTALAQGPTEAALAAVTWRRRWRRFARRRLALVGLLGIALLAAFVLVVPLVWTQSPEAIDLVNRLARPTPPHPLGTDEHGRDVLARLAHGGRVSLVVGVFAAAISVSLGGILGILSGYFGGRTDALLMRITDGFMSVPVFFLLLTVLSIIGGGIGSVILVVGFTAWMQVARVVRSEALRVRALEFITAARALGCSDRRIVLRHVLPQTIGPLTVATTLNIAYAILVESTLSFLGFGVQPPTPSWGNMLQEARSYMFTAAHLTTYPGVAILLTVLAFNTLGDGLRDALDPLGSER